MPQILLPLSLLFSGPASAADLLDYWSYEDYTDDASMVGTDGWATGFAEDDWVGYYSSYSGRYYVQSTTDFNTGDYDGDWGDGGAVDNWLVNRDVSANDMVLRTSLYLEDDDTVGVVCRFENKNNYILAMMWQRGSTSPVGDVGGYVAIVAIDSGSATVLATDTWSYDTRAVIGVELSCDDDTITLNYWSELDDRWSGPDETLTAVDSSEGTAGPAGFYSYDSGGYSESGETRALFGAVEVLRIDEDEDGVADDLDNCEDAANADQADADADGIGDGCDDSSGGEGGGAEGGGEGGGDTGGGGGDTGNGGTDSGGGEGGTDTGGGAGGEGGTDTGGGGVGGEGGEGGTDTGGGEGGDDSGTPDTGGVTKIADGRLTSCACSSAEKPGSWLGLAGLLAFAGLRRRERDAR